MADPYITVRAPERRKRKGGWPSVIQFVDDVQLAAAAGIQWDGLPCAAMFPAPTDCWGAFPRDGEGAGYLPKENFWGVPWTVGEGLSLGGYVGIECSTGSGADFEAIARQQLEESEGSYIEVAMSQILFPNTATDLPTQPDILHAVATADQFADQRYIDGGPGISGYEGEPIIWMNRGDAVLAKAADAIDGDRDGNLWTANGTPVVASAETPSGAIWVSGQLLVARSPIISYRSIDTTTNREMAMAERFYAAGFDCLTPVRIPYTDADAPAAYGWGNFGNQP